MRAVLLYKVVVLWALILFFHSKFENALHNDVVTESRLPNGFFIKLGSLGFDQLFFDLYWLKFIQYVGDHEGRKVDNYAQAKQYLTLLIYLDPHFVPSYFFCALILGGECNDPSAAAVLIDQGIGFNRDNWLLPFIGGVNQYLFAHDEKRASRYYLMASKYAGAPTWLVRQSDIFAQNIPSTIKEINIWDSVYNSALDSGARVRARLKLITLWKQVYDRSPTASIKTKALSALSRLNSESAMVASP